MAKLFVFSVIIPLFLLRFSCGCIEKEREALLQFKASLNLSFVSDFFTNLSSWEKGGDCCRTWDGISCHNITHHVVGVDILHSAEGGIISKSLCTLTSLENMYLIGNRLIGTIPHCLGNMSSLTGLSLGGNQLTGSIPSSLSKLSSLNYLDLAYNKLTGNIPSSLSNLSSLSYLYLSSNELSGCIPESLGDLSSLDHLAVSYNQLNGTVPSSFSKLSSLTGLFAERNRFNQSIASSALPSSLESLSLTFNGGQIISEAFFHNLTKLRVLSLSDCIFNSSPAWIPTFQLGVLAMPSCKMDGQIPLWISTQFSLLNLQLADNNLVGEIPSWLWDLGLQSINLTTNHLEGWLLPHTSAWKEISILDVSNNALCGEIPSTWPPDIEVLLLNNNSLTGNIPPILQDCSSLKILNLANNHLQGIIPSSLANCSQLQVLNLGDNNLKGRMPSEFGMLSQLQTLVIKNNKVTGSFPPSITNCSELNILDVGENLLKGEIPKSIGNFSKLRVLAMRRNNLEGRIPKEIVQLKHLQILDLSSNHLSGYIPRTIFSLQAMMVEPNQEFSMVTYSLGLSTHMFFEHSTYMLKIYSKGRVVYYIFYENPLYIYIYKNALNMDCKGRDEYYTYIFPAMASIDLSDNQLSGDVPFDLGKLKGLKLLNLSMNNLNGAIPNSIVQMSLLETLDFSKNNFSGQIPLDLGSLSYLEVLNLSNNNLSGSIPQGKQITTFTNSSFSGNPNLYGCPLPKKCYWPEFAPPSPISISNNEDEQSQENLLYWIGVGLSYGAGFAVVVLFIVLKREWGYIYFNGVDLVLKFCFPWLRNLII